MCIIDTYNNIRYNTEMITRMLAPNQKFREFYSNSPSDVALSTWECEDLVDAINDDRLSANTLMKFKNLFRSQSTQLIVIPLVMFPVAWFANKWLVGICVSMQDSPIEGWLPADSTCSACSSSTRSHSTPDTHCPSTEKCILKCSLTLAMMASISETAFLITSPDCGKKSPSSSKTLDSNSGRASTLSTIRNSLQISHPRSISIDHNTDKWIAYYC